MTRRADGDAHRVAPEHPAAIVKVALHRDQAAALDAWIESQPAPHPSRAEAIRRLMTCALIDHPGQ